MAMEDLFHALSPAVSLPPAARTASDTGTGVDLQGYDGAMIEVATGTITDGSHTVEVQESDDDVTYAAVADEDLIGTEPVIGSADDNRVFRVGYVGSKRFVRVDVTVTGATTGGVYGATVVRSNKRKQPVT